MVALELIMEFLEVGNDFPLMVIIVERADSDEGVVPIKGRIVRKEGRSRRRRGEPNSAGYRAPEGEGDDGRTCASEDGGR